jgi:antitoxin (DNA-binding transcriptional repressor) of toxin-antitoxin stability system
VQDSALRFVATSMAAIRFSSCRPPSADLTRLPSRRTGSAEHCLALDDVTTHDYYQVMSRVGIADLKAHLSEHLRRVRGGRTLTILDRETPVAQIVPYGVEAPLGVRRATRRPSQLRLPSRPSTPTDSTSLLLQDRAAR